MKPLSTRQAAMRLGLAPMTLGRYMKEGKIPAPKTIEVGNVRLYAWTGEEVEMVRQLLPKIADGRKTRHMKKLLAKPKAKQKPQARAPVPHKKSRT